MKRFKSFLITASSILTTAILATVLTPEWAAFLTLVKEKFTEWGVPLVVIALIGVLVSEIWKGVLNRLTIRKYENIGAGSNFADRGNELY